MHRTAGYSESKGERVERKTSERVMRNNGGLKPIGTLRPPRGGKLAPISTASKAITEEQRALARMKFDMFDTDESGSIDKSELKNVLGQLLDADDEVLELYAKLVFNQADTDFSGALSFDEFCGIYSQVMFEKAKQGFSYSDWRSAKK